MSPADVPGDPASQVPGGQIGSEIEWGAVVPVKLLALAKSRLAPYGDAARAELALAFADDVVAALLACPPVRRVVVVTDDVRAACVLRRPGTCVVGDVRGGDLNAALEHGAQVVTACDPGLGVLAVTSDLPALRAGELADLLSQVTARSFVADADGVGTTLLAAPPGRALRPAYGPGSRARHLGSGAAELAAPPSLRRDVDTPDDLAGALALGVGPATGRVAGVLRLAAAG